MKRISHPMPYPGLRPFRTDEADLFFGREEQVDALLEKLETNRFLAVTGPSGCGKSSLVHAGLIPALNLGLLDTAGEDWRIAAMRPGSAPLENLARALMSPDALGPERIKSPDTETESEAFLLATLQRGPLGLAEALAETPLPEDADLLILADQFEELFRYRREDINEAEAFTDLLLASARLDRVYVVITMRSDFFGEYALFPGLPEALNEGLYLTPRLTRDQRRGAIIGPAAMFEGGLDEALVTRLLNDMGADPDRLPVLQHTLMRMWTRAKPETDGKIRLGQKDCDDVGGMERALSDHADEAYNELDGGLKPIAETLFKCLCDHAGPGRDTRRPVELSKAAWVAGADPDAVKQVVEKFQASHRNFLTLNRDGVVDISHESLIRQWERLKKWAKQEADSAAVYKRLEDTARLWKKDEAAEWGTPDLDTALAWKEEQHPTPQWAERYGGDFGNAMVFLDASVKKRKLDEEKKKREFRERTRQLFDTRLTQVSLHAKAEDYAAARNILNQTRELDAEVPASRCHARNLLAWYADLMGGQAEKVYPGAGAPLMNLAVSPDGRLLAAVGEKGTVALFDVETGKLAKRLEGHENVGDTGSARAAVFHPDGKWLATAGDDRRILFWSVPDGEIIREIQAPDGVHAMALGPDGKLLASGGRDKNITLWDAETGRQVRVIQGRKTHLLRRFLNFLLRKKDLAQAHDGLVSGLAFSPDSARLASAAYDKTAKIWDVKTGEHLYTLRGHADNVENVAFHPNGRTLATCSSDKSVILWDIETGKQLNRLQGHANAVVGLAFSENGDRLISAGLDRTLRIWDTDSGTTLRVLQGHEAGVTRGLAVGGNRVFSAGNDMTVRQWDLRMEDRMRVVDMPGEPASSLISHDGSSVAVGFANGGLRVYGLHELRQLWEISEAHASDIQRISFRPDGKYLATASFDKTVKIWRASDGKPVQTFEGHSDAVHGIDFSPDGKHIATACYDGRIGLFEIGGEEGRFHKAHEGRVTSVNFDSTGENLVSSGEDGKTRLWDIREWPPKLVWDFPESPDAVMWAAVSPDGSRVASVGRGSRVAIFNTNDGSETHRLIGHENIVCRVAFSPDGGQVATASADATVRFWDLETGKELFALRLPTNIGWPIPLWDFSFRNTPAGCWLAVPLTRGKLAVYRLGDIYGGGD